MERFQHIGLAAGVGAVDGGEGQDLLLSDSDDVGGVLGDIGCGEVQRRVIPEGQVVLKIKLQKHVHSPLIFTPNTGLSLLPDKYTTFSTKREGKFPIEERFKK